MSADKEKARLQAFVEAMAKTVEPHVDGAVIFMQHGGKCATAMHAAGDKKEQVQNLIHTLRGLQAVIADIITTMGEDPNLGDKARVENVKMQVMRGEGGA